MGAVLAGAVLAGVLVAPTAAQGAPSAPAADTADATLQAPDIATAQTVARLENKRVEVIGERTETSTTWVFPNGLLSTDYAAGPIRVRHGDGDGTAAADWAPVDLTLERGADGLVRSKVHPADLVLAGGGVPADGTLAAVTGADGQVVRAEWAGELPTPKLAGPRATYPDIEPGVDLVVEATRTGFEQFYVLTDRPEPGNAPELSLALRGDGLAASTDEDGGAHFSDATGQVVGTSGTPLAWDASVDDERLHPITAPWKDAGEADAMVLAPPKEPALPDHPGAGPSIPEVTDVPVLGPAPALPAPAASDTAPADAGQGSSKAAADAGASPALPLQDAATVVGPGAVDVSLSVDDSFLQDADTQYPVVIDPSWDFVTTFDTFVQTGISSDQSSATELRIGTYDGGAHVARSFLNFNINGNQYKPIISAELWMYEWYSYTCTPTDWSVWETDPASTATRITAQPAWGGPWSSSDDTRGYGSGCAAGWASADVSNLAAHWSATGKSSVGMGIRAADEADSNGWKKFASRETSSPPTLRVFYNSPPGVPTGPVVLPSLDNNGPSTSTLTPTLTAVAHDAEANPSNLRFDLFENGAAQSLWWGDAVGVADNGPGSVKVPAGVLQVGKQYSFYVRAYDQYGQWSATPSVWSKIFTVDPTPPAAPVVASTDYPNDNQWHKSENQAGAFTLTLPAADPTLLRYEWALDKTPDTQLAVAGTTAGSVTTLSVTPTTNGRHELQVLAVDGAGNRSPVVKYKFNVGEAGLLSPAEGSQVVRRVRLTPAGDAKFTHVKFVWRRGPDAATTADIALGALTRADGQPLTSAWTALSDLGAYATWDASLTLGPVAGPVQVQALMATDAQGAGAYATPWTTVTVSPDVKNGATTDVGPGSANLLTGDYTLFSTDVDEFGLSLQRSTSSRDPRSGLDPQEERLTAAQQTISAPDGFTAPTTGGTALSRITGRGHTVTNPGTPTAVLDALRVAPTGGDPETFAHLNLTFRPGATYRVTGWIYVPAGTGLTPDSTRGLRIIGYYKKTDGSYGEYRSGRPEITDGWQQLSVDFTVPADAAGDGFVRLYNGFSAAGKDVFFDDLSVKQIWSPLGAQWSLGTADAAAGTAYTHISRPEPEVAELHLTGGGTTWFTAGGGTGAGQKWWPEAGAESLTLTQLNDTTWQLTDLDGTVSRFERLGTAVDFQLTTTAPPAAAGATRYVYENVAGNSRLTRMIAPVEPGVDNWPTNAQACTTAVPAAGCEVMELAYATTTTATPTAVGAFAGQLDEVRLWSTEPGAAQTSSVTAARYAYDSQGRLREVWDPRISPALKTSYTYDSDGRVLTLGTPGELPWTFAYGSGGAEAHVGLGDLVDRSSGRLLRVSRPSLEPGTLDQTGPDTTTTLVYAVPLNRADGGPYDLDPASLATWAQTTGPTDATAVFGPEDVPAVTTASASTPGANGYKPATVHYLDASGEEVNTASPSGPSAPAEGSIDTSEYDAYGNVARSLDATGRLLALGLLPTATTDLTALNLTTASTAVRAVALSTLSTYGPDGLDLLRTRGPLLRLAVGNDPNNVQLVYDLTTSIYDEGKPDGAAYHLATTQTEALLLAGSAPEQLVDVGVTTTGYNPIDGASALGATSGWVVKQPTVTTVDAGPGGANLTARVRYNDQGKVVESRKAGSTGSDAGTVRSIYYTAGANPDDAACGNNPGYAGLPCVTKAAGAVSGHDASRMAGALPVKRVTGYNRYGSITSVTESATGPVAGATVTQNRTTDTVYDAADRVTSVTISGTGTGTAAVPLGRTVSTYDPASGDVTRVESRDPANDATVVSATQKTFDQLGRMTRYDDGAGGVTTSVFDRYGKPTTVSDSLGTSSSFTYDRTVEPRGFATSVTDSVGGTLSASYGPDGQLMTQSLPGGVKLSLAYDANRNPISRTYTRTSDDQVIASSAVLENGSGQWITHTTAASTKTYAYDRIGRLTDVADTTIGAALCTSRRYGFNDRAERTSMTTATSGTSTCADPGNPGSAAVSTTGYTYDSADRLVSDTATGAGAWIYDPLGRITTAPVRGSPGASVQNAFYAKDLVASQTIAGVARQTWTLDALQRFSSYTNEAWAVGGNGQPGWQQAVTKVNHYDSDSDSPAWIAEDTSLPDEITRYVDGLDGNLAVQTGKTGARVLQLVDLHGDVMTTVPIQDGQTTADWTGLRHQTADEYGNPTNLTTGTIRASTGQAPGRDGRYGWLGGKQRSADALANVILMGVRLYDPGTGRFWSIDPSPGGNATAYDYCSADPVNCSDLDGRWGWLDKVVKTVKKAAKVIAPIAELASMIPGPIGVAAAGVSAVAYAASGNKGKALEMGITAAAAMIPGGGAMAKAGMAAAKSAGRVAARAGRAVAKAVKGCNSFVPETGVLMADGSTVAIGDVAVGDLVEARDPVTGVLSAQPVLNVLVGQGDKHLIKVLTVPAPNGALDDHQAAEGDRSVDAWTATDNHPIWVEGQGWTDAGDLGVGDLLQAASGQLRLVKEVDDLGWLHEQVVFNLSVANVHTYIVGNSSDGVLVHNSSCGVQGVYALVNDAGKVMRTGRTTNLARRAAEHQRDFPELTMRVLATSRDKKAIRGLEQLAHEHYQPIFNRIEPIGRYNPRKGGYMKAGSTALARLWH